MTTFSEAIRLEQGRLHNLAYHQARVDRTAGHFFGTCPSLMIGKVVQSSLLEPYGFAEGRHRNGR